MTTQDPRPGGWRAAWEASAPSAGLRAAAKAKLRAGDLDGAHAAARNSPLLHLEVHLALLRAAAGAPPAEQARALKEAIGAPLSSVLRRLRGVPPEAPVGPGLLRGAWRRRPGSTG